MSDEEEQDQQLESSAYSANEKELLIRIWRELRTVRQQLGRAIFAMHEAEAEVPEKMRRFANYFHDVVHIKGEYHSLGLKAPDYIDREMERCADRFRHLLDDLHTDGGTFEQVRRDMAQRSGNVYDHTRQLEKPK
jgi:hypothetical protein